MALSLRTVLVATACFTLAGVAVNRPGPQSAPPAPLTLPSTEAIDSLSVYLGPVEPAPRLDEYGIFVPAPAPTIVIAPPPHPAAPAPAAELPAWRLSAILLAGDRPLAIIDDQTVYPGSRISGGAEVIAIEKDRVLVRTPDGVRRTLPLPAG